MENNTTESKNEIVYILTNESTPDYIKIGRTSDLERRMKQLDNTSTVLPFECFYACTVKDMAFVEKQMHITFDEYRVRSNREFFKMSQVKAANALKMAEIKNVTPRNDVVETEEDQKALNKARSRRPNFNFKMLDIPVGSILTFVDDSSITAEVVDNVHIEYNDEITSVSAAAIEILNHPGTLAGTLFWKFDGEILNDRRTRLETSEE